MIHHHPERTLLLLILAMMALVGYASVHEAVALVHHIGAALDAYLAGGAS